MTKGVLVQITFPLNIATLVYSTLFTDSLLPMLPKQKIRKLGYKKNAKGLPGDNLNIENIPPNP